jgi:hypothetical protein
MMRVARLVATALTLGFGILAIPFIILTMIYILSGAPVGPSTLLVLVVYAVALVGVVVLWVLRARKGGRTGPSRSI